MEIRQQPTILARSTAEDVASTQIPGSTTRHWSKTQAQWAAATLLAMMAGYLDGYGFFFLKTYVSFMSGNTTSTGLKIGQGVFQAAIPSAIAIVFFATGSFLGNVLTQSKFRHSHRLVFGLIAIFLAIVSVLHWSGLSYRNRVPLPVHGDGESGFIQDRRRSCERDICDWLAQQTRRLSSFGCRGKTAEGSTRPNRDTAVSRDSGFLFVSRLGRGDHLVCVSRRSSSSWNCRFVRFPHVGSLASYGRHACA